jgi:hypothetical protein
MGAVSLLVDGNITKRCMKTEYVCRANCSAG